MFKNLLKTFPILFLLFASDIYALKKCNGVNHYTWDNCTGSHTLQNGMFWKGEYQKGGPNGSGILSYDMGSYEGVITSMSGIVTGIKGKMYGLSKGTNILVMDAEWDMDELDGGTGVAQGIFYYPDFTINGFLVPATVGQQKYVGKYTLTNGAGGFIIKGFPDVVEISEKNYRRLESRYIKERSNYHKSRSAEIKKLHSTPNPKSRDFQKRHSQRLSELRALRVWYLRNRDITEPLIYNSDIYIEKFQSIE